MKQTYEIDDISRLLQDTIKIKAKTPLEAVKKAYPDYEVKRDFDNIGNIVVTGRSNCRYVRGYRKYVYCITPKQTPLDNN